MTLSPTTAPNQRVSHVCVDWPEKAALRERVCRRYMLAPYRSGRRTEALDDCPRTRRTSGIERRADIQHDSHLVPNRDPRLAQADAHA
ncbi:MAG: hypothetical protein HOQ24_04725 [Mycobacteriaceae bacterium]|nr:hypothetical protein [Mycobacteriaceae bacterium]